MLRSAPRVRETTPRDCSFDADRLIHATMEIFQRVRSGRRRDVVLVRPASKTRSVEAL
jgi:hypothetical protein